MKVRSIVFITALTVIFISSIVSSCAFTKKAYNSASDAVSNVNVFPYTEDIKLGQQVRDEIASKPNEFPLLKKSSNRELYNYLESLKTKIINTGEFRYAKEFPWELHVIDDDKTLNAFATPGGYIYIYTGLIKFLDSEDQMIGVLGHEMAHSDRRHSTRQLTKSLGLSILLDAVLGQRDAIEQIVGSLVGLKFSRSHESEADLFSVTYLCKTSYNSDGAAGFFKKMANQPTPPEFLSTHPNPTNRVEKMEQLEVEMNCSGNQTNKAKYEQIKKLI